MRYLVKARVKTGQEQPLLKAIEAGTLGRGSVAGDEYLDNMSQARVTPGSVCTGSRRVFVPHLWKKNGPTGNNISSFCGCPTPMLGGSAAMPTELSRGPAATAIVPGGWKNDYRRSEKDFWRA